MKEELYRESLDLIPGGVNSPVRALKSVEGEPIYIEKSRTYRDWETDRKSTRLNSSHSGESRMPSSA